MGTLLVFLIVFIPMGWVFWRLLRFTRNTIGTNSPLKVQRIYQTTFRSFFVRLESVFVLICLFMGFVILKASLFATFSGPDPMIGRTILIISGFALLCTGMFTLVIDLNHWPYARGVVITTLPDEHELDIQLPDTTLRIKEGDIRKITMYHNEGKLQHGFAQFQLNNGNSFLLPFKTEGIWVINEYFKGIPMENHIQHVPLIRTTFKSEATYE